MKPLIESTERSLLKKFPFRTAIVERVEDEELEATGILIESVKQTMPSVLSQAVIEVPTRVIHRSACFKLVLQSRFLR